MGLLKEKGIQEIFKVKMVGNISQLMRDPTADLETQRTSTRINAISVMATALKYKPNSWVFFTESLMSHISIENHSDYSFNKYFFLFSTILFIIAKNWKQPRCTSINEWKHNCSTHTMELSLFSDKRKGTIKPQKDKEEP